MDKKFYLDVPYSVFDFLNKLRKDEMYLYQPSLEGVTKQGGLISLGYSCYALKIYFMTSKWEELNQEQKDKWIQYINSFQTNNNKFPNNSYIDQNFLDSYSNFGLTENIKYGIKSVLNTLNKGKYDTKNILLKKSINAETKQALATLSELNYKSDSIVEFPFKDSVELLEYLNSLNWGTPWSSGAQYSSICVFSKTQGGKYKKELEDFIGILSNKETGSYHSNDLSDLSLIHI